MEKNKVKTDMVDKTLPDWIDQIEVYCENVGITPYQLIEQHKYFVEQAHEQLKEALKSISK